ncbi:unnamed protein product, partial [Trichogramma brassicae]
SATDMLDPLRNHVRRTISVSRLFTSLHAGNEHCEEFLSLDASAEGVRQKLDLYTTTRCVRAASVGDTGDLHASAACSTLSIDYVLASFYSIN